MIDPITSFNCGGTLLSLEKPLVMGILNLTPDSFFDGGRYATEKAVLLHCEQMLREGAAIIDIGGTSSRPGAAISSPEIELQGVLPSVKVIRKTFPDAILSSDTYWSTVAEAVVGEGVQIINDISAGQMDAQLWPMVARLGVPYILMHMQGTPQNMQMNPQYSDVTMEVLDFMIQKVGQLRELGVKDLVVDPGFGFGKSVEHNFELLTRLPVLAILGVPVLVGLSRKSMICKTLKVKPENALNGTTALHMVALQNGAKILRVHDVKEASETIRLWEQLEQVNEARIPIKMT